MESSDPFETPFTALQYYSDKCNDVDLDEESQLFYLRMWNMAYRIWEESVDRNIRTHGLVMSGYPAAWFGPEKGWDWWPKGSHGDEPFVFT